MLLVSAMWGLWHMPVTGQTPSLPLVLTLVIVHTLIGVPLTIFWRRSGSERDLARVRRQLAELGRAAPAKREGPEGH
jgi:hypothetical protein